MPLITNFGRKRKTSKMGLTPAQRRKAKQKKFYKSAKFNPVGEYQ